MHPLLFVCMREFHTKYFGSFVWISCTVLSRWRVKQR